MNDDVQFHENILDLPWFKIQFLIRPGDKYDKYSYIYIYISNCCFINLYFKAKGLNFFKFIYVLATSLCNLP